MPSAAAPTLGRNTSSVPSATRMPAPRSPINASLGTKQLSNLRLAMGWGATMSIRSVTERPGVSAAKINALYLAPSRAKTRYCPAMPPLEIQVLTPSRAKPPLASLAVMVIAAISEPASGSDSAKPVRTLPLRGPGNQRSRWAGVPNRVIPPVPSPCMANAKSASAE